MAFVVGSSKFYLDYIISMEFTSVRQSFLAYNHKPLECQQISNILHFNRTCLQYL